MLNENVSVPGSTTENEYDFGIALIRRSRTRQRHHRRHVVHRPPHASPCCLPHHRSPWPVPSPTATPARPGTSSRSYRPCPCCSPNPTPAARRCHTTASPTAPSPHPGHRSSTSTSATGPPATLWSPPVNVTVGATFDTDTDDPVRVRRPVGVAHLGVTDTLCVAGPSGNVQSKLPAPVAAVKTSSVFVPPSQARPSSSRTCPCPGQPPRTCRSSARPSSAAASTRQCPPPAPRSTPSPRSRPSPCCSSGHRHRRSPRPSRTPARRGTCSRSCPPRPCRSGSRWHHTTRPPSSSHHPRQTPCTCRSSCPPRQPSQHPTAPPPAPRSTPTPRCRPSPCCSPGHRHRRSPRPSRTPARRGTCSRSCPPRPCRSGSR